MQRKSKTKNNTIQQLGGKKQQSNPKIPPTEKKIKSKKKHNKQ